MDISKFLEELRKERDRIDETIRSYERLEKAMKSADANPPKPGSATFMTSSFIPDSRGTQEDRDTRVLELHKISPPKSVQSSLRLPALTPEECDLVVTVAGSDGVATIERSFPSKLLESMFNTVLSSSPGLLRYYETADQATESRLSLWIRISVLELWGALMLIESNIPSGTDPEL